MMPQSMPDPIRATICRRCNRRPVAGEICAECEVRPSVRVRRPVVSADDLLAGGWVAYQHPEGEPRPLPTADHPGWSRLAREVRPVTATAPKVATVAQVERRRREMRRRLVAVVSWVVMVVMCLIVGWAFADGIGGAR